MSTVYVELRAPAVAEQGTERKKAESGKRFGKRLSINKLEANVNGKAFVVPFGDRYTEDQARIMSDNVDWMRVEAEPLYGM